MQHGIYWLGSTSLYVHAYFVCVWRRFAYAFPTPPANNVVIVEEAEQILPYTFTGELQKYSLASDSEIVLDKLDWFFRISGVQKIELNWIWRKFGLL